MPNFVRKHPMLWTSVAVAVASLCAALFLGLDSTPGVVALAFFWLAAFVAGVIMNYTVFSATPGSTIYRPGSHPDDDTR